MNWVLNNFEKHTVVWVFFSNLVTKTALAVNTFRPRQNGRPFPDNILRCIFLSENVRISISISLKSVLKGPIEISQHWFRLRPGADLATSHYLNQWWFVYWHMYALLDLNELRLIKATICKAQVIRAIVADAQMTQAAREQVERTLADVC